jgi:iron complex outermembrane recepter protein
MTIRTKCQLFLSSSIVFAVLLPGAAFAQSAPAAASGKLEDVVVTAQRRSESVQDVPIAVSAFSPAELERRNISEALDIIQFVPNLMGSNNTGLGSANAYYLRGLGNTESIATFDPPVGTYIDDIYVSRQNGNNFSFFDVERVEVLRGPQGTLFGRNTTGGAVSVYIKKPGDEFAGFGEVGYGRFDRVSARGSVDLPLSEGFRTKISGYFNDDQGYVRNVTTGERLNDLHNYGVRAAIQARATDKIVWDASIMYTKDESSNLLNFDCNPANRADCDGRFVTTGLRRNFANGATQYVGTTGAPIGVTGRKANLPMGNDVSSVMLISNVAFENENSTLNIITGYLDLKQQFNLDFFDGRGGPSINFVAGSNGLPIASALTATGTNVNPYPAVRGFRTGGFAITNDGKHSQFTQEFKLSGKAFDGFIDYVTGLYYIKENNTTDFADIFTLGTVPTGFPLLLADRTVKNSTKAWAGYAQIDVNVTEQVKLTAGVRYTDEKKTAGISDNRALCAVTPVPATCMTNANVTAAGVPLQQSSKLWTPRVAINFKPTDDILLFASATRGFKSGGWNARSTAPSLFLPFGRETVWSYEAGAKTEWLDNRLRLNVTGFWQDTKDYQIPSAFLNPATGALVFITRNFADFRNKGVEVEFQAVPVEGLTVFAALGLQDPAFRNVEAATLNQQTRCRAALAGQPDPVIPGITLNTGTAVARAQSLCGVGVVNIEGNLAKPVRSPKMTLSGGMNYEFAFDGAGKIIPAVSASYIGKQEVGTSGLSIYSDNGVFNAYGGDFITGSRSKAVIRVNASVAYETEDALWRATAECDNCFGETQNQSTLSNYSYINGPSTWMVKLRRKF